MQELAGRVAVVTGGASGIGRALAARFVAEGMSVVIADIEKSALDEAAAGLGPDVLGVLTDVSDPTSVDSLAEAAVARFGRVHVLCNNAGVASVSPSGGQWVSENEWRWVLEVNLWGVIHGHRAFLPHLVEHGDGHIVNTASMAGLFPGHSAYTASKWAVVGITEGLYHDENLRAAGIGVSCLCPGWVNTAIAESARNRPEWAAPRRDVEPTAAEEGMRAFVLDQLRSGMEPAAVADLVHDAVLSNTFWIFTDRQMVAGLEPRYQAMLAGTNPPPAQLGG